MMMREGACTTGSRSPPKSLQPPKGRDPKGARSTTERLALCKGKDNQSQALVCKAAFIIHTSQQTKLLGMLTTVQATPSGEQRRRGPDPHGT